jgi:hypothetical protein
VSPGVIPTNGSHWQEQLKPAAYVPNVWAPELICTTCSRTEDKCKAQRAGDDDHPFVSRARNAAETRRPPEAITAIVTDLRNQETP